MKRELLRLEGINFGQHGQNTLSDFSMALYQGEILGVLSDHAVVKNDLIGIIAGRLKAGSGRLYLGNEPSPFEEADPHRHRKVGIIHSAKTLVDDLSISENIFVIRKGFKAQVINSHLLNRQTQQLMDDFGLAIDPKSLARNLSAIERCSVEIVKTVALGARIVVLQDLSSFLSDSEVEQLLKLAVRLKHKELGFLMIDSSVRHLSDYADRVIVTKKGRNFWAFNQGELNERVLKSCFYKEQTLDFPDEAFVAGTVITAKSKVLVFDQVKSGVLDGLSFSLDQGEELCIFDQEGKGIDEIKALLSGERQAEGGCILADGELFKARNVWQALDQKIAFVVENPADAMLFPDFTAIENLCYPSNRKAADFWINPIYLSSCQREYGQYFAPDELKKYPYELSTQSIHKLIYCRWHLYNPRLVVCIKPFSSVEKSLEDISTFFIDLLLKKGIAVLILTSNASEADIPCRKVVLNPKNALLHPKNAL